MNKPKYDINRRAFLHSAACAGALTATPSLAAGRATAASISDDLTESSASELSLAIRTRKISCVDVMHGYLSRIERHKPVYNAIVGLRDRDELVEEAALADRARDRGD